MLRFPLPTGACSHAFDFDALGCGNTFFDEIKHFGITGNQHFFERYLFAVGTQNHRFLIHRKRFSYGEDVFQALLADGDGNL